MNEVHVGDCRSVLTSAAFHKYRGNVSIIYIDPPYNTGNRKFPYRDSFDRDEYADLISDSLSVGKEMLKDSGVIFISIDDNELITVRTLADIVFGDENFLGTFVTNQAKRSNSKHVNVCHEYVLCYAKDKRKVGEFGVPRIHIPGDCTLIKSILFSVKNVFYDYHGRYGQKQAESYAKSALLPLIELHTKGGENSWLKNYNQVDENGNVFYAVDLSVPGKPRKVDIPSIGLHLEQLPTRAWVSDDEFVRLHEEGRLHFRGSRPYRKKFLWEAEAKAQSILPFWSRQGTEDLSRLGAYGLFPTAKPVELVKHLIRLTGLREGTVLDFFAGSGTTAQAVVELNKESECNFNFVLVQKDETVWDDDVLESCNNAGIAPLIQDILWMRLNRVYKKLELEKDYELFNHSSEA